MLPRFTARALGRASGILLALATVLSLGLTAPASADVPPQPGDFRGRGFDQCTAPSQHAMTAWAYHSLYQAVGIYISGKQRACRSQPNLTPSWVRTQTRVGWRLLPITLGPQPWCNPRFPRYGEPDMYTSSRNRYAKARNQGYAEGVDAVRAASNLGIPAKSTLWYDLEGYDISRASCRLPAMAFVEGWVRALHAQDYVAGVYSSAGSGLKAIFAEKQRPSAYRWQLPDRVWIADWDGKVNVSSSYLDNTSWMPGDRLKQYRGGHNETWGRTTINIDNDWLVLGAAARVSRDAMRCGSITTNYPSYYALARGTGFTDQVKALQCQLQKKGWYDGALDGRYDQDVIDAANAFLKSVGRPINVPFSWADWTALLSNGTHPLVKMYSRDPAVRDLQRALNAAMRSGLNVSGKFDYATRTALISYQRKVGLSPTGNAMASTWRKLNAGVR